MPVIGKEFREVARARLLFDHLSALSQSPFRAGPLRVPTPLALLPDQRMVLYRASGGTPLDRFADPGRAVSGARAAARWLALLHGSSARLPRRLSLANEHATSRQWAALVADAVPSAAGPARALADGWATAARPTTGQVPIHKDFHAGHVLVGRGVCVVDLDEARLGDPALDVAHFCTYLTATGGPGAGQVGEAFLDEYAALGRPVDPDCYPAYCAWTWLKIAKQIALGSGPFRDTAPTTRRQRVGSALERGLACLAE